MIVDMREIKKEILKDLIKELSSKKFRESGLVAPLADDVTQEEFEKNVDRLVEEGLWS